MKTTPAEVRIRGEEPEDLPAIREVIVAAGGGNPDDAAADLVDLLRSREKALISLVAQLGNRVVGHIMFSVVTVDSSPEPTRAVGLAPLMVSPEVQRRGIGTLLVRAGLKRCVEIGSEIVVVLGSQEYYPRFGFSRAKSHGLDNEYGADEHFMVLEVKPAALDTYRGMVRYASEFRETGC